MIQILKDFFSQNVRRMFWMMVLCVLVGIMFWAGQAEKAIDWIVALAAVALTQIRSNNANPELTPRDPIPKKDTTGNG